MSSFASPRVGAGPLQSINMIARSLIPTTTLEK
jgi:hypothetical protein